MPNLNDIAGWIEDIKRQIARLKSGAFLENASVTNGRLRFIGGLLLIDSGGTLQVIGRLTGNGNFEWSGPWKFNSGDGEIAGNVKLTGDFDLTGKFTSGNVRIEDGKIYVGTGAAQIVIDGATGKITAGNMTIDPSGNGGQIDFGGSRVINAGTGFLGLYDGERQVIFNSSGVTLVAGGKTFSVGAAGVRVIGIPTVPQADVPGSFPTAIVRTADGYLAEVDI